MSFNKYRLKGAYHYDWYEAEPWYKECVDTVVNFCQGTTLDVGCGDGLLTQKISQKFRAVGIDPDLDGIMLAKKHAPKAEFIHMSAQVMRENFQYMACLNVIEHMPYPQILKDIINLNITKGAIIITNQYLGGSLGEDHVHEYDYQELLDFFKEFETEGFKLMNGEYIGIKIKL